MLNIVLYEPEIPPNTGNIGRLCHAAGLRLHLIEPLGFSLDEKSLRRAGLDYWNELDVSIWKSFDAWRQSVPAEANVYFLTTKNQKAYWDQTFSEGDCLVFGPETRGLPESLLQVYEPFCLTIPQIQGRSLNLATSVGIVAYEGLRQLNWQNK
ncbi:MAG: tRNA (cytidine(34)-2'-O)-methyltransferase [Verrucomicrobiales bacterium]|nr:tRNA (cytidine(34)-2'-O)-methyltransferase [Verrucomicrobiales bacterium]